MRYGVGLMLSGMHRFPLATFLVNITGSFAIGYVMAVLGRSHSHPLAHLFLVTGVLGGYTTFSSFTGELHTLARQGSVGLAGIYAIASVAVGLGAVWCGALIAMRR